MSKFPIVGHQRRGKHGSIRELHHDMRCTIREAKQLQILGDLEVEYLKQHDIVQGLEKMLESENLDQMFGPGGPRYSARLYNICPKRQESAAGKRITTFPLSIFFLNIISRHLFSNLKVLISS